MPNNNSLIFGGRTVASYFSLRIVEVGNDDIDCSFRPSLHIEVAITSNLMAQ